LFREARAFEDRNESLSMKTRLAWAARRSRSCGGSDPVGSTSRSKRCMKAFLAGAVISVLSRLACSAWAAREARVERCAAVISAHHVVPIPASATQGFL